MFLTKKFIEELIMNTLYRKKLIVLAIVATFTSQFSFGQVQQSASKKDQILSQITIRGEKIAAPNVDGESKAGAASILSDTASLLENIPGMSLYKAGGLSSLPSLHGLADDRLRIQVDGMNLISACANHMNPPLSYIDPSNVGSVQVLNGIAPVSSGGDSIGGTIKVNSSAPVFANEDQGNILKGQAGVFFRSNSHARGANVNANYATPSFSLNYSGAVAKADNYLAAKSFKLNGLSALGSVTSGREVGSSAYQSENHALGFAIRGSDQLLELKLGLQDIPLQGFPNQRMDMTRNRSEQINLHYRQQLEWGNVDARIYHEHTQHRMNFSDDKQYWYGNAPGMPMETAGHNTGAVLKADWVLSERDKLILGSELQRYRMNDWWNASGTGMMMAPNTFINIKDGERNRLAIFAEWEAQWSPTWFSQLGVRSERVRMDSGAVAGYNNMAYGDPTSTTSIPGIFNHSDRQRNDNNIDVSAVFRFAPDSNFSVDGGYAYKTRSPNLYERYTWANSNTMVMNMNNWFGDGNGYVGNLQLKPEIAQTLSATIHWQNFVESGIEFKLAPFYTRVRDYIDAVACSSVGKICAARKDGFVNLSLSNQQAELFGIDLSFEKTLAQSRDFGKIHAKGGINYVRGENTQTRTGLYNIMPLNAKFSLQQQIDRWTNTLEWQVVNAKSHVSEIRRELNTSGYALVNLRASYDFQQGRIDFGVENLTNRFYSLPLGGAYLGQGATMGMGVPHGTTVPGVGRSMYVSGTWKF